jgi:hypothetical protein
MDAKTYLKVSIINLAFLLVGVMIGATVVSFLFFTGTAHAQSPAAKMDAKANPPQCDESRFECVSPTMTSGPAGFYQLLSHQVAADQVMVQGIDLLKLHENTLNLLKSKNILTLAEIQKVVDDSRVAKPLRLRAVPTP